MTPLEYDSARIWHPYASLKNPPPVFHAKAASGVEIETADGLKLVDAVSSWWCVAHGYNHPAIVEAIRRQSEKMCHVMFGASPTMPPLVSDEATVERIVGALVDLAASPPGPPPEDGDFHE